MTKWFLINGHKVLRTFFILIRFGGGIATGANGKLYGKFPKVVGRGEGESP